MSNNDRFEDSLAFKAFVACPIPGVDVAVGATVYAATEVAKSVAEGIQDTIKEGVKDGVKEGVAACATEIQKLIPQRLSSMSDKSS